MEDAREALLCRFIWFYLRVFLVDQKVTNGFILWNRIVSKVQFLSTSPDLSLGVDGFEPNKDEHDSFVELEPVS